MEHDPALYGDRIAEVYDEWYAKNDSPSFLDPEGCADMLAELAAGSVPERSGRPPGRALELGIGTGRVALPLAARGVEVHGIDSSSAMVERLRAKPDGDQIPVTVGDFADVPVEGTFSLVYVPFTTFFALMTQEDQVRCFAHVASHLDDSGRFVIEAFVPDLGRFERGQSTTVTRVTPEGVQLDVGRHDPLGQRIDSQHVLLAPGEVRLYPVSLRYAWPSELDLMARLAGMTLEHRWSGWPRERLPPARLRSCTSGRRFRLPQPPA